MIKRILTFVSFCVASVGVVNGSTEAEIEEAHRNEAEQVELWEAKLAACRHKPDALKMTELWLGLRNMGYRNTRPRHSPDVTDLYVRLQQEILSIPGHAEFYVKPIWESYAAYRDADHPKHSGSATWFGDEAHRGMETLKHLPSPETVKLLGEMLWEVWEADRSGGPRESDLTYPSALAHQAAWTLLDLPLREKPTTFFERYAAKENLPAWQAWYERVKSGEIPISFKGQAVEYRFNPDGTWQTISIPNPPDDAPEITEARPSATRAAKQRAKEQPPGNAGRAYRPYLLAGLAGLLALAAAWFGLQRTKAAI